MDSTKGKKRSHYQQKDSLYYGNQFIGNQRKDVRGTENSSENVFYPHKSKDQVVSTKNRDQNLNNKTFHTRIIENPDSKITEQRELHGTTLRPSDFNHLYNHQLYNSQQSTKEKNYYNNYDSNNNYSGNFKNYNYPINYYQDKPNYRMSTFSNNNTTNRQVQSQSSQQHQTNGNFYKSYLNSLSLAENLEGKYSSFKEVHENQVQEQVKIDKEILKEEEKANANEDYLDKDITLPEHQNNTTYVQYNIINNSNNKKNEIVESNEYYQNYLEMIKISHPINNTYNYLVNLSQAQKNKDKAVPSHNQTNKGNILIENSQKSQKSSFNENQVKQNEICLREVDPSKDKAEKEKDSQVRHDQQLFKPNIQHYITNYPGKLKNGEEKSKLFAHTLNQMKQQNQLNLNDSTSTNNTALTSYTNMNSPKSGYTRYSLLNLQENYIKAKYSSIYNTQAKFSQNYVKIDVKPKSTYFIIKSFNIENIHKAIKYGVWSTTYAGNTTFDKAFSDAQSRGTEVYLFFSTNSAFSFQGIARLKSKFQTKSFNFWKGSDKYKNFNGSFLIEWIVIKDVPNSTLDNVKINGIPFSKMRNGVEIPEREALLAIKQIESFYYCSSLVLLDFMRLDSEEKNFDGGKK